MSERLDAVLNGAKDAVREAEVMAVEPDQAVAAMAALLADGVGHLAKAFQRLDPDSRSNSEASATDAADAAVKTQRQLERVYRQAASALLEVQDLREVRAGESCTGASRASVRPSPRPPTESGTPP
jgi:hypothetical protein